MGLACSLHGKGLTVTDLHMRHPVCLLACLHCIGLSPPRAIFHAQVDKKVESRSLAKSGEGQHSNMQQALAKSDLLGFWDQM